MKSLILNFILFLHNSFVTWIPSHTFRKWFLRSLMNIQIGESSSTHIGLRLYTYGHVTIGAHCVIDRDYVLDGRGEISIATTSTFRRK